MKRFINIKYKSGNRETIDEFDSVKEARENLKEYRMASPDTTFYISRRFCKGWNDK